MAERPVPTGDPTAGLLLAAGAGSRLGVPKARVEFAGERLVDRGVRVLREAGCHPVVVVLGAARVPVEGAVVVHNPDWSTGMGSSLRAGLDALPSEAGRVVITLVDQPGIGPEAVTRLVEAARAGAVLAVATYGGAPRNPVLITREHMAAVARSATGDAGARGYLRANATLVTRVPCDDIADPADIDTPEDLAALTGGTARRAAQPPDTGS
ncbi:nucleotidyltransferase family protein [Spongiactinospora sp. TRM90649]|uniref:nucleotidyltransferase family protein n=1 Tax=Spongiactinospora sp. TRM90649 TaxID=3031114 RepID=UPI0023F90107|nr:nucleotidyltransferase family protein [Spongiactinospora sp. TRM90649]MDF5756841.1 nucleotidyltransferase family protein [Spongiactinospora sp. TRM90649]